ncbi:hypothetical protein Tco_0248480 [Tanacetum coccineum]
MHIRNDPSFFLTNKTGAPQGEELGLINPLSNSSFSCSDNSFISEGANRLVAPCYRCSHHGIRLVFEIPLVESQRKDPTIPQENTSGKGNLELSVHPQVASSPTCLPRASFPQSLPSS